MAKPSKNTVCLWYDRDAEEAAQFYARTFPDSSVGALHRAPADFPSGKKGDVLTVEFTVMGIPCIGLNGGPGVKHNWAFSFQVATADQTETDRYWNAILEAGGQESQCGWCTDTVASGRFDCQHGRIEREQRPALRSFRADNASAVQVSAGQREARTSGWSACQARDWR